MVTWRITLGEFPPPPLGFSRQPCRGPKPARTFYDASPSLRGPLSRPPGPSPRPAMPKLYLVEVPIPEIDALPGDVLVDHPTDGLRLVRLVGGRAALAFRSTSLRLLASSEDAGSLLPMLASLPRSDLN